MDGLQTFLLPLLFFNAVLIMAIGFDVNREMFCCLFSSKIKTVCTVRTAKWATGIVGIILTAYNSIKFFATESRFSKLYGGHDCAYNFDINVVKALDAVDSVLYSFGPFIIMFLTNFVIVFKFMRAKCQSSSTESTNQALVKVATRGTAMVVTVSVTFLLLTSLSAVCDALLKVIPLQDDPIYFIFRIFTQYLNHSINGVLYCIVETKFRKDSLKYFVEKEEVMIFLLLTLFITPV